MVADNVAELKKEPQNELEDSPDRVPREPLVLVPKEQQKKTKELTDLEL